ncbi:MAG TPA: selenium cofactor biosynthesis protein YqeC, partial [Anaerolineaceae bacterium]|nr:selenium cofactor biosynthesis protein YqeC [Anaerolineaceae bacterium]
MDLRRALRVDAGSRVAFVGAGGKTTAMFQLAHQLPQPVLVTTTTHLGDWQISLADHHRILDPNDVSWIDEIAEHNSGIWLLTGPLTGAHRFTGPSSKSLAQIRCAAEGHNWPVLIEADGSRQKPIKMPADYEPAIPDWVNHVVVVCGLSGLNKPLSADWFHRPELATELLKLESGSPLTADHLTAILTHPLGGLKNIPVGCQRSVLLNQADELEDKPILGELPKQLTSAYHRAFTASLKQKVVGPVCERTAAVILAAGAASRFGAPKVLLNWDGIPFIRRVALTALESGLEPVVVVLGSNDAQIRPALNDLNVVVIHNSEWQTGQSSSVRLGVLLAEKYGCGGAGFLLADQPQVT